MHSHKVRGGNAFAVQANPKPGGNLFLQPAGKTWRVQRIEDLFHIGHKGQGGRDREIPCPRLLV